MIFNSKIPILTYHSIDESGSVISTSPSQFKKQMKLLKQLGFQTISVQEILECIHNKNLFPKKSIAITFDDGFKNNYSHALPILREYGFTATIFIVGAKCNKYNDWDAKSKNIPKLQLMNWDEIREMSEYGIEFGAHTMTHINLSKKSLEEASEEIINSRIILEQKLKKDISFFAYPYGKQTDGIQNIVQNEFAGAFSDKMGLTSLTSNIHSLPRIEMYYFSKNNHLQFLNTPFFFYYVMYRQFLRSIKSFLNIFLKRKVH